MTTDCIYDVIVVGAGSAGCIVASRLSADARRRVCVIENGGSDRSPAIHIPGGIPFIYGNPRYDYRFVGAPQTELYGRRISINRGKTLGGSSSINSMLFIRGVPRDYDEWRSLGCVGWGWENVLPVFKSLERNLLGQSPEWHGFEGELPVDRPGEPNVVSRMFVHAADAIGLSENTDFNGEKQDGLGIYNVTQQNGQRCSSYRAFLKPVEQRANLTILTKTEVRRIIFDGHRAAGVEVICDGRTEILYTREEIILSAGAINSPALLMRSGIGPGGALQKAGIPVRQHLPGVGQNLQDHVDGMITVRSRKTHSLGLSLSKLPELLSSPWHYWRSRTGLLTTNYVEAGGFARTRYAKDVPDIQFHFIPAYRVHDGSVFQMGHGHALQTCVLRPRSVGEIRMTPSGDCEIDNRFLSDQEDALTLTEGIKMARRILAHPVFDVLGGVEVKPGKDVQTDDELLDFLRRHALTVYHPVGTCKMGNDDLSVCNHETLCVNGVSGLRVADASVMPRLIGGNTNVPSMMIGEMCARMVLAER